MPKIKVLHIINKITNGGASMGVLNQCLQVNKNIEHVVLSLEPPTEKQAIRAFEENGISIYTAEELEKVIFFDIVQVEWWNNPVINNFLINTNLPDCRILLHARGHFDAPMMCPSYKILERVDFCSITTPSAADNPRFTANRIKALVPPPPCIFSSAITQAIAPAEKQQNKSDHHTIFLGYLGTVELIKLHRNFLDIIKSVVDAEPMVKFLFAGEGNLEEFKQMAQERNLLKHIEFLGFVEDVPSFLNRLDIFFYPLNPMTYATSEKALQEAMLAGLPSVVFPYGGIKDLINSKYGIIASDQRSFVEGCLELIRSPKLRLALGNNARKAFTEVEHWVNWKKVLLQTWNQMLKLPKRPRNTLQIPKQQLLEYSTDINSHKSGNNKTVESDPDYVQVSSFTLEAYNDWVSDNT